MISQSVTTNNPEEVPLQEFLATPPHVEVSCLDQVDGSRGKLVYKSFHKTTWFGRALAWYNRSPEERDANRRAINSFHHALQEQFDAHHVNAVYNTQLVSLFRNGSPLTSECIRKTIETLLRLGPILPRNSNRNPSPITRPPSDNEEQNNHVEPPLLIERSTSNEPSGTNYKFRSDFNTVREAVRSISFHDTLFTHQSKLIGKVIMEALEQESLTQSRKGKEKAVDIDVDRFLAKISKLPFPEISIKRLWDNDQVVDVNDAMSSLDLLPYDNHIRPDEIPRRNQIERNRRAQLIFKAYILRRFGPIVMNQIWHNYSDLDALFKAGAPIRKSHVRDAINHANLLILHHELANYRWIDGPPTEHRKENQDKSLKLKRASCFSNTASSLVSKRIVWIPVDAATYRGNSGIRKRIENKQTILAFMEYLEDIQIDLPVCSYLWERYFRSHFASGDQSLTNQKLREILREARDLQEVIALGNYCDPNDATRQFMDLLDDDLPASQAIASIVQIQIATPWLGGKRSCLPTNTEQILTNRELLLNLGHYLKFQYGRDVAIQCWKSKLLPCFTIGLSLNPKEVVSLLNSAQKKAQNRFVSAEQRISTYCNSYLRDSKANRKELKCSHAELVKLQANFKSRAFSMLWQYGKNISDVQLDQIAYECYHQLNSPKRNFAHVERSDEIGASQTFTSTTSQAAWANRSITQRIHQHQVGDNSISNRFEEAIHLFYSIKTQSAATNGQNGYSDEAPYHFEMLSSLADLNAQAVYLAKNLWVIGELGFKDWVKFFHDTLDQPTTDQLQSIVFAPEAELLIFFGSLLGALANIHHLRQTNKINAYNKNTYETLFEHQTQSGYLLDMCKFFSDDFATSESAKREIELPPEERLESLRYRLEKASRYIYNELCIQKPLLAGAFSQLPLVANIGIDLSSTACAGLLISTAIPSSWIPFTIPPALGLWGFAGLTLTQLLASGIYGYETYKEYKAYRNCRTAKDNARRVLDNMFLHTKPLDRQQDELYQNHKMYQAYKAQKANKRLRAEDFAAKTITNDIKPDIIKSLFRGQKSGTHLLGTVTGSLKTFAGLLSIATLAVMTFGQYGLLAGAGIGTALFPGVGTIVGTILGALISSGIGLCVAVATFCIANLYRYISERKRKNIIQQWSDAFIHHEGPKWKLMKSAGLDPHYAEQLAFRKLIRRDPDLAIAQIAVQLKSECSGSNKPITKLLKKHLRPYRAAEAKQDFSKRLENKQWEAFVDRLASFGEPAQIRAQLAKALLPG